ncbi:hypothetical protein EST38_g12907 [Candolleomyces aberdarensis]|uniref:C3H1-type domain-containing protein n=1 Tax=Candolleomyces aberdarensis TaxID=2316362 RepID=A0A4V1Q1V9_9AGAR|nr:hypothetical protein EST38_g12907 [Candolleomyces aberdarensis]
MSSRRYNESTRQDSNQQTQPIVPNPNERAQSIPINSDRPRFSLAGISSTLQAFSRGEIARGRALSRIVAALDFGEEDTVAKERALESYVQQLEQIERSQHRPQAESSRTLASGEDGSRHLDSSGDESSSSESQGGSSSYGSRLPHLVSKSKQHKRPRTESPDGEDSGWSSEASGSVVERQPRKRLQESDMLWFEKEKRSRRDVNRSCVESARLLRQYGKDVSQVKRWLAFSTSAPPGFPSSEWDNLLRGKAVNLDVVFSSVYHIGAVKENRGRLGEHEISFGHSEPTQKVLTYGDWTIAWNIAVKAPAFLFPHRQQELADYGEFIQGKFSARQTEAHWQVIRFDQSIRNEVGGGTKILLTDYDQFNRHRATILHSDGLFADRDTKHPNRQPKSNDICLRFNTDSGCPNSSSSCKYQHTCKICGKGGHGAGTCEGKK